ncbi:MAG: hypothetical protein AA908_00165 [Chlorobi bacterium NICIL-2]|jgi:2-keto-4-pentenoate hydratase/2-oxohepta-3-ene-1,7-dioic acid hydratase in catechol pathway|nr:MAG: hypothetical protein AA908_00165 [Chlorobi bacterium NICIL-2]
MPVGFLLEMLSGQSLPLGTIYCIGRNYADHAREMNAELPSEPVVFLKPPTSAISDGGTIRIPPNETNAHHEVELVAVIGAELHNASLDDAHRAIAGYAVGIDVTLRDRQTHAKQHGLPWALAKGFATSAPISRIVPAEAIPAIGDVEFGLEVNGTVRQRATPRRMIWSVEELIVFLSRWFILVPGDVVFTGTPEGVGPLAEGDRVRAWLGDAVELRLDVAVAV